MKSNQIGQIVLFCIVFSLKYSFVDQLRDPWTRQEPRPIPVTIGNEQTRRVQLKSGIY